MDFRCEICGCKTEQQELREYGLSGESFNACNFCRKQLDSIKKSPAQMSSDAKNLLNMNTNGRRSQKVQDSLEKEFAAVGISFSPAVTEAPFVPASAMPASPVQSVMPNSNQPAGNNPLENEVADLRQQLQKLSDSFFAFRRRYYIVKIVSVVLPVVLVLLMLIVLVASGALKNLFNYYNTIMDYANM